MINSLLVAHCARLERTKMDWTWTDDWPTWLFAGKWYRHYDNGQYIADDGHVLPLLIRDALLWWLMRLHLDAEFAQLLPSAR